MMAQSRIYGGLLGALIAAGSAHAQSRAGTEATEISLRKSVIVREFQGKQFSGEERQIGRGDSLWRILVEEKGLPERRFRSYLVVISGLNPQINNFDVLRAGDKIFIPLNVADGGETAPRSEARAPSEAAQPAPGRTINYQVKPGEHLYRVLRERYRTADERRIAQYFALVKDLNPERQNWETLRGGEIVRLPALDSDVNTATADGRSHAAGPSTFSAPAPIIEPPSAVPLVAALRRLDRDQALRAPARENIALVLKIAEAAGNQVQSSGEESVLLPEGTIRFDRGRYPIVYNAALRQKAVIDPDGKIPGSLKAKLNDPRIGTPVVAMAHGLTIADAVRELLASVGYQPLAAERPIVVQEAGVSFEARGNWMALAPTVSNKPQEVLVINLAERANEVPRYLIDQLAKLGIRFHDIVLTEPNFSIVPVSAASQLRNPGPPRELPKDKRDLLDALLLAFHIPFGSGESIFVELRDGLRMETRVDRIFEVDGKRTAVFFQRADPIVREALKERQATNSWELDIDSLSSRELILQILRLLGEDKAMYGEHRFAAGDDRLIVKAWGFNVRKKPLFVTDRQIPAALQRFFFEKGLEIVYFQ